MENIPPGASRKGKKPMNETSKFLLVHGLPIIFGAVFLDQMGVPIPAAPWLLAAGALAAAGKFPWFIALLLSILACLLADLFWFYLGRYRGTQVVALLCRMSLEPDSCVRKTVNVFTRYGWRGIIVAKFVPGMSTVTPPLAGMAGVKAVQFLLVDGLGSLLYSASFILLGYIFSDEIAKIAAGLDRFGGGFLTVIVVVVALYILYKFWDRQRLLQELRTAKITPAELGQMLDAGQNPVILDVRPVLELEQDPAIIRGAIHMAMEDLNTRHQELSRDREIIIYCDCPNEVSSAKTALLLRRKGFNRVRPLLGGIDAWRKANYPMDVWAKTTGAATTTVVVSNETFASAKDGKEAPRTE
jgi:membrane protein DedA with SNARE-associated domain/rhodanese-related sulfurtransferase